MSDVLRILFCKSRNRFGIAGNPSSILGGFVWLEGGVQMFFLKKSVHFV